jgi:hypothetical protein
MTKMDAPLGISRCNIRPGWVGCQEMERLIQIKTHIRSKFGAGIFKTFNPINTRYHNDVNNHLFNCPHCNNQSDNHFDDYINYYNRGKL